MSFKELLQTSIEDYFKERERMDLIEQIQANGRCIDLLIDWIEKDDIKGIVERYNQFSLQERELFLSCLFAFIDGFLGFLLQEISKLELLKKDSELWSLFYMSFGFIRGVFIVLNDDMNTFVKHFVQNNLLREDFLDLLKKKVLVVFYCYSIQEI